MKIPKKQGKPIIYDPAFKIAVAREYLTSSLGRGRLAAKHGLPNADTVKFFVRWYKEKYPDGLMKQTADKPDKTISAAEKDLKEANLKITALEMLIEEASKELQVNLIKKFGTKQSKK